MIFYRNIFHDLLLQFFAHCWTLDYNFCKTLMCHSTTISYDFIITRLLIIALGKKKMNSDNRYLGGKGHSVG